MEKRISLLVGLECIQDCSSRWGKARPPGAREAACVGTTVGPPAIGARLCQGTSLRAGREGPRLCYGGRPPAGYTLARQLRAAGTLADDAWVFQV